MSDQKYTQFSSLNLPSIDKEVLEYWDTHKTFEASISSRDENKPFVFYEGPPSANGMPGIHHVISRTLKDLFCRYKTLQGYRVERKGGWDTHGLPVELSVEKSLGITKEDIGSKISVEEYNAQCRKEVLKYQDIWNDLTIKMGYWVDLDAPYITFDNKYVESLWHLLKTLYDKDVLYKGFTIQPFSPAAGTGLSSHELNQPGCYKDVTDTTVVAQFYVPEQEHPFFKEVQSKLTADLSILAWTTTPWTLPSNTALAVGKKFEYVLVESFNPYTLQKINVIVVDALRSKYFEDDNQTDDLPESIENAKNLPWREIHRFSGEELKDLRYNQLLPYAQPETGEAFKVLLGDFVTTEDGTGIVHLAPSFGADDKRVAEENGMGALTLVDRQGKFTEDAGPFAGRYVKNYKDDPEYVSVDIDIAVLLKKENKAFRVEKYKHSYPHCWRTDKPVIYYPLNSWFIKVTDFKQRLMELNDTINWKPKSTGTGRFANWLENLQDWNLSRSRFWGTPLPIWRNEDGSIEKCIGSIEELRTEVDRSVEAGHMKASLAEDFDLHKPYVDDIILTSENGEKLFREPDLIDVWFDSGAMPYAQWHYPFENADKFERNFPADFIAEGVDQTRGWFYTLHALSTMLHDSVAYKTVVSNGLLLDKNGEKMSKRKGNVVDPFETISKYGADATRWYIISNASPWENLKFDLKGIEEVTRKFFGTFYNTYAFFTLYANIDGFKYEEEALPTDQRPEIDRWILSLLNSLVKDVEQAYEDYEPTKAARAIQYFLNDQLSNWYVRLCRRRFWKGEYAADKISAYQTLYDCMITVAKLASPVAPFFTEFVYRNLNGVTAKENHDSIHLSAFPQSEKGLIDELLEERMQYAQDISSMVLSLRKREKIKVRQPLEKIMIPILNKRFREQLVKVEHYILSEVNVKSVEYVDDASGILVKNIKPDFKKLGPKFGPKMKEVAAAVGKFGQDEISTIEQEGKIELQLADGPAELTIEEVVISSEDIPGWLVASGNGLTVALDIDITDELKAEGDAREFVNRIQNMRKDQNFDVTDKIDVTVESNDNFIPALERFNDYICTEILADDIKVEAVVERGETVTINDIELRVLVEQKN